MILEIHAIILFLIAIAIAFNNSMNKEKDRWSYFARYIICFAMFGFYALMLHDVVLLIAILAGLLILAMSVNDIDFRIGETRKPLTDRPYDRRNVDYRTKIMKKKKSFFWMFLAVLLAVIAVMAVAFPIIMCEILAISVTTVGVLTFIVGGCFYHEKLFWTTAGTVLILVGTLPWFMI